MNTEFRIDKEHLWSILEAWDSYMPKKIHLIACGGTALTIQNIKASTKDVDFLVPVAEEYVALISTIKKLGYSQVTGSGWSRKEGDFIFDFFPGKTVYITELLDSPLKKSKHVKIKSFKKIYVGALNDYDLVITKMFRGTTVDIDDCMMLIQFRKEKFNFKKLKIRYKETADYDVNPKRMMDNLEGLLMRFGEKL